MEKYKLRYWIEWDGAFWLWANDDRTAKEIDYGPINDYIPMPDDLRQRGDVLSDWYQSALNWSDPRIYPIWKQEECDRFRKEVRAFFQDLVAAIGDQYEIVYEQDEPDEHPLFDEYWKDADSFDVSRW
jgi:hypothetical protein